MSWWSDSILHPASRNWGYDVGFAISATGLVYPKVHNSSLTTNPKGVFPEVPRNDDWVKTLMCGSLDKARKHQPSLLNTQQLNALKPLTFRRAITGVLFMTKQKQHTNLSQPRDGGYTIIESLVAMIVVRC
jgi:hypothetical protein